MNSNVQRQQAAAATRVGVTGVLCSHRDLCVRGSWTTLGRMRSLLVSSVVTTLAACKVILTCDAFHVHAVRSTSLRFAHRTGGAAVIMKDSVSTTAESLEDLRKVQQANGGVVGDARYEDGETLWQDAFVS